MGLEGQSVDLGGSKAQVAPQELGEEEEDIASAQAALDRVTSRLADASRELNEIVNFLEVEGDNSSQLRDAREVLAQIKSVDNILLGIFRRGRGQEPGDAFSAVAQASALLSDAEAARDRLPEDDSGGPNPPDPPGWLRAHWNAAVAKLKAAMPQLWAFISRMVTPTQWTVEGNVSTGIFGFAGASISVTFGKAG